MPPRLVFHGGVPGLQPGDKLLPPAATGATLRNVGGKISNPHRSDRVYVTEARETAAFFALEYDTDGRGTVYEVMPDAPLERDPESVEWMPALMTTSATVVRDLGLICLCGSGRNVQDCCGDAVLDQTRWMKLNPLRVERLAVCRAIATLPFFMAVAIAAEPAAIASTAHGPAHWEQVASNGLYLAYPTGADLRVVLAFALLHDAFRRNDGKDDEHGARAAAWTKDNAARLGTVDIDTLADALQRHSHADTSPDATVGACWDADRLDLIRLGVAPKGRYMSTEAGLLAARKISRYVPK